MKKILNWAVWSSNNRTKISATLKNLLPLLVLLGVSQTDATLLQNTLVSVAVSGGTLVAALGTLWGFARKVWRTYMGENDALNA